MTLCKKCGRCCRDWENPEKKCEFLADDLVTCKIHDKLEELDYNCYIFPNDPAIAIALHPLCGFRQAWEQAGIVDKDGRLLSR